METVVVRSFDNYFSANIMLNRLQQDGVKCFLIDENTATIYPVLINAIGGIKLAVAKRDIDKATELLVQYDVEYLRSVLCPVCNGNNIELISKPGTSNLITAVLTWLFSTYAVAPEKVYQCQDCGYESVNLPQNNAENN